MVRYYTCICVSTLSGVRLFATPGLQPVRLLRPWNFPGKHTRKGCRFLLQRIFRTQGSNMPLLHWQADSLPLSHLGSPIRRYTHISITKTTLSSHSFLWQILGTDFDQSLSGAIRASWLWVIHFNMTNLGLTVCIISAPRK